MTDKIEQLPYSATQILAEIADIYDEFNRQNERKTAHGVKESDIVAFLNNPANHRALQGKSLREVATYYCQTHLWVSY